MSIEDEIAAIEGLSPYRVSVSSSEYGPLLDQDLDAFVLIKREPDGTTQWMYRGVSSFEASGLVHWAWRNMCDQQDDLTGESERPLPDEEE